MASTKQKQQQTPSQGSKATPDWSRIGRKSRRKGKKYETTIAGCLRECMGLNWQTTRNSGRTDLKGDLYCLDRADFVVVECKDRETFQPLCMLQENAGFVNELDKVRSETKGQGRVVVFSKVYKLGDFVGVLFDPEGRNVDDFLIDETRTGVIAGGVKWRLVRYGLTCNEARRLLLNNYHDL